METIYQYIIDRFWEKVYKTETCWHWNGGTNGKYPLLDIQQNKNRFQRDARYFSLEIHGLTVPQNMLCSSTCGNNDCVNPQHIFFQERGENMTGIKINRLTFISRNVERMRGSAGK